MALIKNIIQLPFVQTVKQYPYRTARVMEPFISLDLREDEVKAFEQELVKKSGPGSECLKRDGFLDDYKKGMVATLR